MIYWMGFALYVLAAFAFMGAVVYAQGYLRFLRWQLKRHGLSVMIGVGVLLTFILAVGRQVFPSGGPGDMPALENLFAGVMLPLSLLAALEIQRFRRTASDGTQRR